MNIVLLQGGRSSEREISLRSSKAIAQALRSLGHDLQMLDPADYPTLIDLVSEIKVQKPDLVFIGLHGGEGEDGTLQAIFEAEKIVFTGSGSEASKLAMDKYRSTCLAQEMGIPVPQTTYIQKSDLRGENHHFVQTAEETPSSRLVIKPNNAGSSVGTHIIDGQNDLRPYIEDAFKYDNAILIQQFIAGRELTVSILGDKVLPVVEIKPTTGFYDYKNKYTAGQTEYICPAQLTAGQTERVQSYAQQIFTKAGCSVYGRVDFIWDEQEFYFLEINTLPGMTELSLVPMSAKQVGIGFEGLIEQIVAG